MVLIIAQNHTAIILRFTKRTVERFLDLLKAIEYRSVIIAATVPIDIENANIYNIVLPLQYTAGDNITS